MATLFRPFKFFDDEIRIGGRHHIDEWHSFGFHHLGFDVKRREGSRKKSDYRDVDCYSESFESR